MIKGDLMHSPQFNRQCLSFQQTVRCTPTAPWAAGTEEGYLSTDLLDSPFNRHYLTMTNGEFENLKKLYISLTTEDDDLN